MVVGEITEQTDLVVIGGGPGGYTAAVRAGQLGIKTILVDQQAVLGGVCLREGCIPSKALLHVAEVIGLSKQATMYGINFGSPQVDLDQLRSWKGEMITKLSQGIASMCKSSKVEVITGQARFLDEHTLFVNCEGDNPKQIKFKQAIIATGSSIIKVPGFFKNPQDQDGQRILDSRSALQIPEVPKRLLIVGGGYIGLELGSVYASLGSEITLVEMTDGLLPGVDRDLVRPLANHLHNIFKDIFLSTKVSALEDTGDGISCELEEPQLICVGKFDYALIAVGRKPNTDNLGLENTSVKLDKNGFISVNEFCRTSDERILAIGDVTGPPMLAHRAMRQGHVAAEVVAGLPSALDNLAIPTIVYTEPEIAWCGLTETEAKAKGQKYSVAKVPWSVSGRALTLGEPNGLTKIIYEPDTMLVKGVGVTGARAGGLISEAMLAIESGLVIDDLVRTIHPHPSLSETIGEAATAAMNRKARQKQEVSATS
jgi:dihydrolipoamide dehydrogenase